MLKHPNFDIKAINKAENNIAIQTYSLVNNAIQVLKERIKSLNHDVYCLFNDKANQIYDGDIDCVEYIINTAEIDGNVQDLMSVEDVSYCGGEFTQNELSMLFGIWTSVNMFDGDIKLQSIDAVFVNNDLKSYSLLCDAEDSNRTSFEVVSTKNSIELALVIAGQSLRGSRINTLLDGFSDELHKAISFDELPSFEHLSKLLMDRCDRLYIQYEVQQEMQYKNMTDPDFENHLYESIRQIGGSLAKRTASLMANIKKFNEYESNTGQFNQNDNLIDNKLQFASNIFISARYHDLEGFCHNLCLEKPVKITEIFDIIKNVITTLKLNENSPTDYSALSGEAYVLARRHFLDKDVIEHYDDYCGFFEHPVYLSNKQLQKEFEPQNEHVCLLRLADAIDTVVEKNSSAIEPQQNDARQSDHNDLCRNAL